MTAPPRRSRPAPDRRPVAPGPPAPSPLEVVTGGAGFLGVHLVERLLAAGRRVVVLDDLSAPSDRPLPRSPGLRLQVGDVREPAAVAAACQGATAIHHLASVVGVDAVRSDPERTGSVIRDGTRAVLAMARRQGCALTFFSSSEVTDGPRSGPRAVYAEAKRDAEELLAAHAHELPLTIVRPFNVVGPGQTSPGMVLPALARAARTGEPLPVHGDGRQERSLLHVDDFLDALLAALATEAPPGGRLLEIGSEERISIGALADRLAALAGHSGARAAAGPVARDHADREDRPRRAPDLLALRGLVAFRPRWTLDAILHEALAASGG